MQILLADDDPVFRDLVTCMLSEWGFVVYVAKDGTEAWNILQQADAPVLAILDWMMPGMDGFEVCRQVRRVKGTRVPYVLLMTGNSKRDEILKVLVAGADDYLLKPFEPLDLKIRLRLAIRVLNLQEEAGTRSTPSTATR